MSDSVRPHRQQPIRFPRPWDSPGKNTGVGCHFLLQWMKGKNESEVAQSCPTLSDPMDCTIPGFSIHGIFQARVLGSHKTNLQNSFRVFPLYPIAFYLWNENIFLQENWTCRQKIKLLNKNRLASATMECLVFQEEKKKKKKRMNHPNLLIML